MFAIVFYFFPNVILVGGIIDMGVAIALQCDSCITSALVGWQLFLASFVVMGYGIYVQVKLRGNKEVKTPEIE